MFDFFQWTIFLRHTAATPYLQKKLFWPVLLQNYMEINCKTAVSNHLSAPPLSFFKIKYYALKNL